MDKFSINNILKIKSLDSEFEFERASSLFLQLRVLAKEDNSYSNLREHLAKLIGKYEELHWKDEDSISDEQIKESDLAEAMISAETEFYAKRKELIKLKLKQAALNQNDLAKILGHRKGYMSELINGLRPFSKEDIIIINRLFKIKLDDLIPTFIKEDKVRNIKHAINTIAKSKIRFAKNNFDLQVV